MIRIPYPLPPHERALLMQAGQFAIQALAGGHPDTWRSRHNKVEKIIADIQTKYGINEPEEMK